MKTIQKGKQTIHFRLPSASQKRACLRTFARKFCNIDFFLQISSLKDDELVMSEVYKKWGVTDFVLERTCPEEHPKSEKNPASLANKATVSESPKILQIHL